MGGGEERRAQPRGPPRGDHQVREEAPPDWCLSPIRPGRHRHGRPARYGRLLLAREGHVTAVSFPMGWPADKLLRHHQPTRFPQLEAWRVPHEATHDEEPPRLPPLPHRRAPLRPRGKRMNRGAGE